MRNVLYQNALLIMLQGSMVSMVKKSLNELDEAFAFFRMIGFFNERLKTIREETIAEGDCGGHIP